MSDVAANKINNKKNQPGGIPKIIKAASSDELALAGHACRAVAVGGRVNLLLACNVMSVFLLCFDFAEYCFSALFFI